MQKWVHLTLADGKTIDATEGHPFNTPDGWRDAILLKKGGELILKGEHGEPKSIQIADVKVEDRRLTTYNLEVANAHTFFVGEDAVLVHNGKPRNKPPSPDPAAHGRPHSIIERPGRDGQYTTFFCDGSWKQYRGSGQDHGGIPRPNVKEPTYNINPKTGERFQNGTNVRPPTHDEFPK